MAGAERLTLVLAVEGYGSELQEREFEVRLRMASRVKNRIQQWMQAKVRARVQAGLDVDGQPFAPKKDGTPATLQGSGAMLHGISSAFGSDLRSETKTRTVAAVGITCRPKGDPQARYPWFLHNGVDPEHIRERELAKIQRKLQRKQDRLQRKTEGLATTKDTTKKWYYLQETVKGINSDIAELQKQQQEINAAQFHTLPARKWWGLTQSERDQVENALRDWVQQMIQAAIAEACNPAAAPSQEAVDQINQSIIARFPL